MAEQREYLSKSALRELRERFGRPEGAGVSGMGKSVKLYVIARQDGEWGEIVEEQGQEQVAESVS